jgi:hypothetical protein
LKAVAEGRITAAYKKHSYPYNHAGLEEPNVERLNSDLQDVGQELFEAHKLLMDGNPEPYREAQRNLVEVIETPNGSELRSKYPKLFNAERNSEGDVKTGGIVWNRFDQLNSDVKQVVGHTKGAYMKNVTNKYNPQWKKNCLNINTIRDAAANKSEIAVTMEDSEKIEVFEI